VDDDAVFLKLLEIQFLEHGDFKSKPIQPDELCIENLSHNPDLVILDYLLDGVVRDVMNGIETLDKIKLYNAEIPVIMLSAQDKIDVAINCMHHAAFDYVVKSETAFMRLQKIITTILRNKKTRKTIELVYGENVRNK